MTLSGIETATVRFVAQHLDHCTAAVPLRKVCFIVMWETVFDTHTHTHTQTKQLVTYLLGTEIQGIPVHITTQEIARNVTNHYSMEFPSNSADTSLCLCRTGWWRQSAANLYVTERRTEMFQCGAEPEAVRCWRNLDKGWRGYFLFSGHLWTMRWDEMAGCCSHLSQCSFLDWYITKATCRSNSKPAVTAQQANGSWWVEDTGQSENHDHPFMGRQWALCMYVCIYIYIYIRVCCRAICCLHLEIYEYLFTPKMEELC